VPSLIQKRLSRAGLSRQTVKGTPLAAATWAYGVDGGSIFKLALEEAEIPLTWSNRDELGYDRAGVKPGQSIGTVATPNLIGLLLLGILGSDVVTGSSAPYTHTITPAAVLPYLTAFGFFGTADWAQLTDSKISSLELSWTAAGKVTVKAEIMSITPAMLAAAYTETNLEILSAVGYFTAGGGTFNVEGVSAQIASGSIKFDTHISQPIVAATVLPADVVEGKLEVTWSLKILPTDTHLFRGVYFGAETLGALSGIANTPRLGAISCQFMGPSSETLTIASTVARYMVDFPESSPEGGAAELTLAATSLLPTSGPSVTATLLNAVAAY
jgi:hypothetical protein